MQCEPRARPEVGFRAKVRPEPMLARVRYTPEWGEMCVVSIAM